MHDPQPRRPSTAPACPRWRCCCTPSCPRPPTTPTASSQARPAPPATSLAATASTPTASMPSCCMSSSAIRTSSTASPTNQPSSAILALVIDPLVDQILDLLDQQLPSDLHLIVLAEAALATELLDAKSTGPPSSSAARATRRPGANRDARPRRHPGRRANVICYARTANPGTVGQRHLQRQRTKLQAEVADNGWTVVAWVEDLDQSGTLSRPRQKMAT
jgi:hypothetical protein